MSILYGNTETASVGSPSRHVTLRKGLSLFCKFGNEARESSLLGTKGRRQQPGGVGGAAPGAKWERPSGPPGPSPALASLSKHLLSSRDWGQR